MHTDYVHNINLVVNSGLFQYSFYLNSCIHLPKQIRVRYHGAKNPTLYTLIELPAQP